MSDATAWVRPDDHFDMTCNFSVLTHLSQDMHGARIDEP